MADERKFNIPNMDGPATYRIRVNGSLDASWSDRLGGMSISTVIGSGEPDISVLEGELADQAALTGILNAIVELHMPVISVECLDS